jgi:uncharacterized protein (DUF362 family)
VKTVAKTTVVVEDLLNVPGAGAFKDDFRVPVPQEFLDAAVQSVFDHFGGGAALLKSSKKVFIKPNAIDFKPFCFTDIGVLEALIKYFQSQGASQIFLIENSTQSNFTRLVFEVNGYNSLCKRYRVKPIYLDEQKTSPFTFRGKLPAAEDTAGYDHSQFEMPETVVRELIQRKAENLYIDVPKLKTHSMTIVTLGIKNQWAFPRHFDRKWDHNYNLHGKLVDVLECVQPDFTIIDGLIGTIHGHYPLTARLDQSIIPTRVLVGGPDVLATDIVGARIFGLEPTDVPHLRIAMERGMGAGVQGLEDIELIGDLSRFTETYPTDIIPEFPPDVILVRGADLACREGCVNNPLMCLQNLWLDFGGKGKFTLIFGKGFDQDLIDTLEGPVFIAGHCANEEVGQQLQDRLGPDLVYYSDACNNLAATNNALFHLMGVSVTDLVPLSALKSIGLLLKARLHHSKANVPSIFAKIQKNA